MGERAKWTPGPWTIHDPEDGTAIRILGDGSNVFVAKVIGDAENDEVTLADARLIAAAPAMAEAIRATLDRMDYLRELWGDEGITRTLRDKLAAALALALAEATPPHRGVRMTLRRP